MMAVNILPGLQIGALPFMNGIVRPHRPRFPSASLRKYQRTSVLGFIGSFKIFSGYLK
jgi:hypothetical protein